MSDKSGHGGMKLTLGLTAPAQCASATGNHYCLGLGRHSGCFQRADERTLHTFPEHCTWLLILVKSWQIKISLKLLLKAENPKAVANKIF